MLSLEEFVRLARAVRMGRAPTPEKLVPIRWARGTSSVMEGRALSIRKIRRFGRLGRQLRCVRWCGGETLQRTELFRSQFCLQSLLCRFSSIV